MSDGMHYGCYTVDYHTGRYRLLHWGQCVGFSARTKEVAIADDKQVGEYKRGGARVGPHHAYFPQNATSAHPDAWPLYHSGRRLAR